MRFTRLAALVVPAFVLIAAPLAAQAQQRAQVARIGALSMPRARSRHRPGIFSDHAEMN